MELSKDLWRIGWTHCPGCGSFSIGRGYLCESCELHVASKCGAHTEPLFRGRHRFLMNWLPGEDDRMSNLLLALKGRGATKAWRHWAEQFLHRHGPAIGEVRDLSFVAGPIAKGEEDHSSLFAKSLAELLGRPYAGRPLRKKREKRLRFLTPQERWSPDLHVKTPGWRPPSSGRIIFIDDVLTTGATSAAISQVLHADLHFETWTLAARGRLSCGVSNPVIGN